MNLVQTVYEWLGRLLGLGELQNVVDYKFSSRPHGPSDRRCCCSWVSLAWSPWRPCSTSATSRVGIVAGGWCCL